MMNGFKECKLCDDIISDTNFKVIEDDTKSIFDVLLVKLTLDNETQNVMCTVCHSKLLSALNFKSTCAYTDDILFPYINFEDQKPVDLKEVYAKEEESKQGKSMLDDREVCRLCFQLSSDHRSIQEVSLDDIETFIPEIKFAATTNPVICTKCHDELRVHSSFIRNCLEVEKRRNTVTVDVEDILLIDSNIKTEEIEIKSDPIGDEVIFEILCDIKKEQDKERETSLHAQNNLIDAEETESSYGIENLKPTSAGSVTKTKSQCGRKSDPKLVTKSLKANQYKCDKCEYNTRDRRNFTRHLIVHKDASEMQTYRCGECEFVTKRKSHFKRHLLNHKHPSEVRMYMCDVCDYKSLHKHHLKTHQLQHKDASEVPLYMCDKCTFITKHKGNLRQHGVVHKDASEVQKYTCDKCDYKSVYKSSLKRHQQNHRDASQVLLYKCDACDFASRYNRNLKKHQFIHKDAPEARMYMCDKCDFSTKHKASLVHHQLRHKNPSEMRMYLCDKCKFRTKHRGSLAQHSLRHRDPSEVLKRGPKAHQSNRNDLSRVQI